MKLINKYFMDFQMIVHKALITDFIEDN